MKSELDSNLLDFQRLYSDPFTGLGNLFSCLVDLSGRFGELAGHGAVQLGMVDVDGLAELNDKLGRYVGDQAVLLAKSTLLDVAGHCARVYRFSRDEFAIVGAAADSTSALECAENVVATYRKRALELFHPETAPTVSMGISVVDPTTASVGSALLAANTALAAAKSDGGNRAEVVDLTEGQLRGSQDLLTLFTERIIQTLDIIANVGELALTDPLTGLPNQRAAQLTLSQLFDNPEDNSPSSVLLVDGDRLREYNSQYGYSRGNQLICDLVDLLTESKRKDDFLARWFVGDEFLLILRGAGAEAAGGVAERLRETVEGSTVAWPIPVTISVGTATYPTDAQDAKELIRLVQEASNEAKKRGKNRVVQASDLSQSGACR